MTPPDSQHPADLARSTEERELIARALAGDREAFGQLVASQAGPARRLSRAVLRNAEDAEDAAQDAFVSAWTHLDRFDARRPFGPWLLRIVLNAARDRLRRRSVRNAEELDERLPAPGAGPDRDLDRERLGHRLRQALDELPLRQRLAVVLFDVEGYPQADIARILAVPEGTVRSDVFHARKRLRKVLAGWNDSEGT